MSAPLDRPALPPTILMLGANGTNGANGSIVFCPDYGGNVLYARPLVPLLAPSLQCLGLRLTPEWLAAPGGLELEAIGERFATDIDAAGLTPPIHLIGFSFAGIVAFETARHLAGIGSQAQLWIVDTHIHRLFPHRYLPRGLWRELQHAGSWLRKNRRRLLSRAGEPEVLHRYRQIRFDLRGVPQAYRSILRALYEAVGRYRPDAWPGGAAVLRARHDNWPHIGDDLGWAHLIKGVLRTIPLQTDHQGLLQSPDAVRQVARIILDSMAPSGAPPHE